MTKVLIIILSNAKILMNLAGPATIPQEAVWTVPAIEISAEANIDAECKKYILEQTGLEIKVERTVAENNVGMWNTHKEKVVYCTAVSDPLKAENENFKWKYFVELNEYEKTLACMNGYFSAIEDWRLDKFRVLNNVKNRGKTCKKGETVFAGSSLQKNFPVEKFMKEKYGDKKIVYNTGIGGYTTREMMAVLDDVVNNYQPKKLFINIGTNDLSDPALSLQDIMTNYETILKDIKAKNPKCKIYLMAYYPGNFEVAADYIKPALKIRTNEKIAEANKMVEALAKKLKCRYIDLNYAIQDENGNLKPEYSMEGMHVNEEGYRAIFPEIEKYIFE